MLRAGAYFPPSRNGLSWSPSAAAPGHQERLVLVMGIVPYTFTPPPLLHPLRFARPPKRGTVMDTTPSKSGKRLRKRLHLQKKKTRKFSLTCWESVEAELSDDEFQLQVPIYRSILLLEKFVKKTREGLQLKSFSRLVIRLGLEPKTPTLKVLCSTC